MTPRDGRAPASLHRPHSGTSTIGIANLDRAAWSKRGLTSSADVVPIVYITRPSITQKAVVSLYSLENRRVDCVITLQLRPFWSFSEA